MNKNLHDKVRRDLEQKGELSSLKAKFDKKIKEVLSQAKSGKIDLNQNSFPEFETKHGKFCCALVKDFFEQFDMKMTTAIFMPEAQLESVDEDIEVISKALEISSERRRPLLFDIIERVFAYGDEEEDEDEEEVDEIETSINASSSLNESEESQRDHFFESAGSGYDQSANSLALNEFDYIEAVKKPRS